MPSHYLNSPTNILPPGYLGGQQNPFQTIGQALIPTGLAMMGAPGKGIGPALTTMGQVFPQQYGQAANRQHAQQIVNMQMEEKRRRIAMEEEELRREQQAKEVAKRQDTFLRGYVKENWGMDVPEGMGVQAYEKIFKEGLSGPGRFERVLGEGGVEEQVFKPNPYFQGGGVVGAGGVEGEPSGVQLPEGVVRVGDPKGQAKRQQEEADAKRASGEKAYTTLREARVVQEEIANIRQAMSAKDPRSDWFSRSFGATGWGSLAQVLPGTRARDVTGSIETVQAIVGFDRLQRMREASPTGGALGQVALRELDFLQSVEGKLDVMRDPKDLDRILQRIDRSFRIVEANITQDMSKLSDEDLRYANEMYNVKFGQ